MEIDALTIVLTITIAVALAYVKLSKSEPDVHPLLLQQQSTPTPIRNEGESVVHRSKSVSHGSPLVRQPSDKIKTLYDVWQSGSTINPSARSLMFPLQNQFAFVDATYVDRRISGFGSGLINLTGLKPKTETPVGIMAPYSQESFIAQQAFYRYSFVAVPIHDLRNADLLIEVVNQTKLKAIIVSQKTLPLLLQSLKECPTVKTIIVAGIFISGEQEKIAALHGAKLIKFARVEYDGSSNPLDHIKPDPEDVAMINYNTKSTSLSKGVMLTHANLIAATAAFRAALPGTKKFTSKDRLLCQFSNGDVIAVWLQSAIILSGGSLVFPTGLMKNVLHDAQASAPTIFASTPVILEKVHEALQLTYGKGSLFKRAYAAKLELLKAGCVTSTSLWDFIGLGEIRSRLGGKVRLIVTTNPTKNETMEYIRAAMGIPVISTYGRTETSGIVTSRNMFDYSSTPFLGAPVGCNEVKLVDDVESGHTSNDEPNPRGEIFIRGPNVMKGYFKKPGATAKAVDKDGWFHSGDLGTFHSNGTLEVSNKRKKKAKTSGRSSPIQGEAKE
ncbi:Long-chain-fatty-acid--CoA ligase 5 [Gamsiella multidivaricata]|nr:Long-chain-fatty-acid--CoA ligase 5 [Gamsiella multidivaricata]